MTGTTSSSTDVAELGRLIHCASYNLLAAVISATQSDLKFYTGFLFPPDNLAKVCLSTTPMVLYGLWCPVIIFLILCSTCVLVLLEMIRNMTSTLYIYFLMMMMLSVVVVVILTTTETARISN